jgi:hypothetical protein
MIQTSVFHVRIIRQSYGHASGHFLQGFVPEGTNHPDIIRTYFLNTIYERIHFVFDIETYRYHFWVLTDGNIKPIINNILTL